MHVHSLHCQSDGSALRLLLPVLLAALGFDIAAANADDSAHTVMPIARGNFPHRVHVFEDYETDIEKRWWLRGEVVTKGVADSRSGVANRRACRAVETLNFDRKMGDRVNKVKGFIFNPVPGPPMGKNTRLSFRYRLDGSDSIKVQIYSLSKNFHRLLLLKGLPQGKWQIATVDMTKARRPDGSGGPLAADERIDDIQFYVSRDADLLIDDIVLFDAADRGQREPFPARTIFTGWFDTGKQGKEWPGDFDIVLHQKPRTWDAARSVKNKETGKPWLRVGLRGRRLLSPRTSVTFQYRLSKPSPLRVVLVDSKTGRRESAHVDSPKTGAWTRTRLDFLAKPGGDKRFADEIRLHVEAPDAELLIDDLLLFEPGNRRGSADTTQRRPRLEAIVRQMWLPKAPALPQPAANVIRVSTVDQLFRAARDVRPGGTILLADGHYLMPRYFELRTDRVTLRSESGRRERVVIDGKQSRHGELVGIRACSGVTIANLTIQNIKWNGFKINSNTGVQRFRIYNCVIHNIWQRGVKAVAVPKENREKLRPRDCRIEYCLFYNDRAKRFTDDPADTPDSFDGNYIGGIDAMFATGWTICDNVFVGIRGRTGSARGAIFVWVDSRDCTIERNIIIDCDTGICLGNSHRGRDTKVHCTRCVVRNNFVTRAPENGILADFTRDCAIVHNTIHDPDSRLKRLIRLVHDNGGLVVANNLLSGPAMRRRNATGKLRITGNVTRNVGQSFASARTGNLHLKSAVAGIVDQAESLAAAAHDIDGEVRGLKSDVGADEFQALRRKR